MRPAAETGRRSPTGRSAGLIVCGTFPPIDVRGHRSPRFWTVSDTKAPQPRHRISRLRSVKGLNEMIGAVARPSAHYQSGSDDVGEDHGVDAAGVWVIDVPRAVAQQDEGKDVHDTAAENEA